MSWSIHLVAAGWSSDQFDPFFPLSSPYGCTCSCDFSRPAATCGTRQLNKTQPLHSSMWSMTWPFQSALSLTQRVSQTKGGEAGQSIACRLLAARSEVIAGMDRIWTAVGFSFCSRSFTRPAAEWIGLRHDPSRSRLRFGPALAYFTWIGLFRSKISGYYASFGQHYSWCVPPWSAEKKISCLTRISQKSCCIFDSI